MHIDDLSDWGKNLGAKNHPDFPPAVQVQDEVLLNEGYFLQTGNPIPVMDGGVQKIIDGMPVYYVDFVEQVKPLPK